MESALSCALSLASAGTAQSSGLIPQVARASRTLSLRLGCRHARYASLLAQGCGEDFKLGTGRALDVPALKCIASTTATPGSGVDGRLGASSGALHSLFVVPIVADSIPGSAAVLNRAFSAGSNFFCQTGSPYKEDESALPTEVPISTPETTISNEPVLSDPHWDVVKVVSGDFVNFAVAKRDLLEEENPKDPECRHTSERELVELFAWGAGTLGNGTIFNIVTPQRVNFSHEVEGKSADEDDNYRDITDVRDVSSRGDSTCAVVYDNVDRTHYFFGWGCLGVDRQLIPRRSAIERSEKTGEILSDEDKLDLGKMVRVAAPANLFKIKDEDLLNSNNNNNSGTENETFEKWDSNQIKTFADRGLVGLSYLSKPPNQKQVNRVDIGATLVVKTVGRSRVIAKPNTPYESYPEALFDVSNCVVPSSFYTEDSEIIDSLNVNFMYSTIEDCLIETEQEIKFSILKSDIGKLGGNEQDLEISDIKILNRSDKYPLAGIVSLKQRKSSPDNHERIYLFKKGEPELIDITDISKTFIQSTLKESIDGNDISITSFDASNGHITVSYVASYSDDNVKIGAIRLLSNELTSLGGLSYVEILSDLSTKKDIKELNKSMNQSVSSTFFQYFFPKNVNETLLQMKVRDHVTQSVVEASDKLIDSLLEIRDKPPAALESEIKQHTSNFMLDEHVDDTATSKILITDLGTWSPYDKIPINQNTNTVEDEHSIVPTVLGESKIDSRHHLRNNEIKVKISNVWDHCIIATNV